MAGTKEGARIARDGNYAKYGKDYYRNIGRMGGMVRPSRPRGFAAMPPKRLQEVSILGGRASRRGRAKS